MYEITIGESVLALVLLDFERKLEFYIVVFSAFATMYLILQNYIRSDSDARSHALAEGEICGSILWVCFHGIAAYFLLGMGVGYKMILPYADTDSVGEVYLSLKISQINIYFFLGDILLL